MGHTLRREFKLSNGEVDSVNDAGSLAAILANAGNLAIPGLGTIISVAAKVWLWQMKRVNKKHGNRWVVLFMLINGTTPMVLAPSQW